ncbi:MAG: helix-turn-helix transcriptional regulator [Clostridiales bacterium]|nr:helix-turn-helix transcriptional regulator [Clostridiales bacterium]
MINIDQELTKRLKAEEDDTQRSAAYNKEIEFYELVASGNTEILAERLKHFGSSQKMGKLSENKLRNSKYHAVTLVAMISRFCSEAGMDIATAYNLSDIYIEILDTMETPDQITDLSKKIAADYCRRMQMIYKSRAISRNVVSSIDYIRTHISGKLTVEDVADAMNLNPSYLSKLFKKEMGITISQYIRDQKINIACNMLRHLDDSSLSISNYLGFSSQSHFIQVFKKCVGMPPEEYRRLHYHQSWMDKSEDEDTNS